MLSFVREVMPEFFQNQRKRPKARHEMSCFVPNLTNLLELNINIHEFDDKIRKLNAIQTERTIDREIEFSDFTKSSIWCQTPNCCQ